MMLKTVTLFAILLPFVVAGQFLRRLVDPFNDDCDEQIDTTYVCCDPPNDWKYVVCDYGKERCRPAGYVTGDNGEIFGDGWNNYDDNETPGPC